MAIKFINDSTYFGLFNRLGKIFYAHERLRTAATNLAADMDAIYALYRVTNAVSASTDKDLEWISNLIDKREEILGFVGSIQKELHTAASRTIIETMDADHPLGAPTIREAITELRRQMEVAPTTIEESAVTTSGPVTGSNVGDATLYSLTVPSHLEGSSLNDDNPYIRSEIVYVRCIQDSNAGTAEHAEVYSVRGGTKVANDWYEWPSGSGTAMNIVATTATIDQGGAPGRNILTNSDFTSWSANVPVNWTLDVGAAGAQIYAAGDPFNYTGTYSAQFAGDGSTLTAISQPISTTTGTNTPLRPDTPYILVFRVRRGGDQPTAGVLKCQIEKTSDGSVMATANSGTATISVDCTSGSELSTTFLTKSLAFRTTTTPGTSLRITVEFTTALSATHHVFLGDVILAPMYQPYPGTAALAVISGKVPAAIDDAFNVTYANNYASKWFRELDRFFDLYSHGNMFPGTTGTPTVLDSLIG